MVGVIFVSQVRRNENKIGEAGVLWAVGSYGPPFWEVCYSFPALFRMICDGHHLVQYANEEKRPPQSVLSSPGGFWCFL